MLPKHRFRILAALSVAFLILLAPQLASAGPGSRPVNTLAAMTSAVRANSEVRHERGQRHRRHHGGGPTMPTNSVLPAPAPLSAPVSEPTTTTNTAPPAPHPIPISAPVPNPSPAPDPIATAFPGPSPCLAQHPLVVSGPQNSRFKPSVGGHLAIDARSASWTQVDSWPVSTTGRGSICWTGGVIVGTWANDTTWDVFHHTGGFSFANRDSVIEGIRVHNYGDAINVRDGASNWTVRGAQTSFIHDDCLQDDFLNGGVIADSLFDGCYVGISARPSANNTASDGRANRVTMIGNLLRLQPMPTVYKGPAPGHGGFFKWDDTGRSPQLALHNNIFRADQTPNHGSLGLPSGYNVSCSANTIVWLGAGAFPEAASWLSKCPDTRIVNTRSTWDNALRWWAVTR